VQVEYRQWEGADRSRPAAPKAAYEPSAAPFEGLATYQRDYISHPMSVTRSLKPVSDTETCLESLEYYYYYYYYYYYTAPV